MKEETKEIGFLKTMLSEGSKISSKRVITFGAFALLILSYLCEQLFEWKIDNEKFQYLVYLIEIGLGTIVAERFAKLMSKDK